MTSPVLQSTVGIVDKILNALKPLAPEVKDVQLRCPDEVGVAHVVCDFSHTRGPKIRVPVKEIRRIELRERESLTLQYDATAVLDHGAEIDIARLEGEQFLMEIEFDLLDQTLFRRLVYRENDRDGKSEGDRDLYWMVAQLRHPDALESKYGRVDLRDFDFLVNVGIHQDVKASVPRLFVRQMEVGVNLVRETDRNKKFQLMREQLRLQKAGLGKSSEVLTALQDLFVPSRFSSFLDVTRQFKLTSIRRGTDIYDRAPFPTFPKSMSVVSRTDLSVRNPAAEGDLVYKKAEFRSQLMAYFPKTMARLEEP